MVDYSKWKDIEISDDEDDIHPNIDTGSLFRWRHQARMDRMEENKREKQELDNKKSETERKVLEIRQKLKSSENTGDLDISSLKVELNELQKQEDEFRRKEQELSKKEKLAPWNVDTISKEGFSKTVINKPAVVKNEELSDDEKDKKYRSFVKENESLLKKFGMLQKYDDSKRFLQDHPQLACEETSNYLVLWCISLQIEEKYDLMDHVAHQTICMQYVMELAKQLEYDPRACVSSFFSRIQLADKQYIDSFEDELRAFKERVRERAKIRLERAMQEQEEEDRKNRLGPGGLDPIEVMETLPQILQECFHTQDVAMLQQAIGQLPEEEARYHMKRCIDSGLWVPDAKTDGAAKEEKDDDDDNKADTEQSDK